MNERILIILGAPNSPSGILSSIAKNRLDVCFKLFMENDFVLCTGSWGEHFNTSSHPHAYHSKKYLLEKGMSSTCFLEPALSNNTVDDAVKVKEIISNYPNSKLIIITSDFHVDRATLIFNEILKNHRIEFVGAENSLPNDQLKKIVEHEKKSIQKIIENGLYY